MTTEKYEQSLIDAGYRKSSGEFPYFYSHYIHCECKECKEHEEKREKEI